MMIADMPLDAELPDPTDSMLKERRYGRFRVGSLFIDEQPRSAVAALGGCIVVRAEQMHMFHSMEYVALHPEFEQVPHGGDAPFYVCVFTVHEDGSVTRRFVRGVG